LIKNPSLKIDKHYYLSSQVHPVVSRLCDPIEGTDASFIAECLGEEIVFFLIFYYIKNYFAKNHGWVDIDCNFVWHISKIFC